MQKGKENEAMGCSGHYICFQFTAELQPTCLFPAEPLEKTHLMWLCGKSYKGSETITKVHTTLVAKSTYYQNCLVTHINHTPF